MFFILFCIYYFNTLMVISSASFMRPYFWVLVFVG